MQESQYQTGGAKDSILDSGCKRLYQTADAGFSISDSRCKELYITDSGCKRLYIRQRMQESLYQTADAKDSI